MTFHNIRNNQINLGICLNYCLSVNVRWFKKKKQTTDLTFKSNTFTLFDMSFWKDKFVITKIMTIINDKPVFFGTTFHNHDILTIFKIVIAIIKANTLW